MDCSTLRVIYGMSKYPYLLHKMAFQPVWLLLTVHNGVETCFIDTLWCVVNLIKLKESLVDEKCRSFSKTHSKENDLFVPCYVRSMNFSGPTFVHRIMELKVFM